MIVTHLNKKISYGQTKYLGFAILELNKLLMFETYYDKLQPYFRRENLYLQYMDCGSFVLSIRTKNIIID